jgi:hypothetical protein
LKKSCDEKQEKLLINLERFFCWFVFELFFDEEDEEEDDEEDDDEDEDEDDDLDDEFDELFDRLLSDFCCLSESLLS